MSNCPLSPVHPSDGETPRMLVQFVSWNLIHWTDTPSLRDMEIFVLDPESS